MPTDKFSKTVGLLIISGLLLASCAPAAGPTPTAKAPVPAAAPNSATTSPATPRPAAPSPSPKPAADQPAKAGGTLTVGVGIVPPTFDPHRETQGASFAVLAGAYNGLVKYDPQAWPETKVVPDLATSWQLTPDGKVYTFNLVKGAKFHDGTPVTAEDVKFSFDRIRDPQVGLTLSPRRQQLANVASIDAPDDSTVRITLGYPQASFLPFIGAFYFAVMPKRVVLEKKNDMTKTIMGTGPFKFKNYASGVAWEEERNTNYFVAGRPYLDTVKGYIIADSFTRFAALRTGNIRFWGPSPYMTVSQAKIIEEQLSDKIALKWEFMPAWYGIVFNVTKAPWNDVRVRRAVSLAFDRKRMLGVGLEGAGVVGMSFQAPGEWALPDEEMMKEPGYAKPDIEGAKKLLAEAGYANGLKTDALVWSTAPQQKLGEIMRDVVAPIGVTIDLNIAETTMYMDMRFRQAFNIMVGSAGSASSEPDIILGDFYTTGSPRNWSGYSNPAYDQLYAKQSQTLDPAERRKIIWDMQRMLLKDVPIAVAYWSNVPYAWWKEVRGFVPPTSHYNAYGYQEIWLAQ